MSAFPVRLDGGGNFSRDYNYAYRRELLRGAGNRRFDNICCYCFSSLGNAVVQAFEKVAEASQLKSEFVAIISHELRNPLSSIKWQLDAIFEKAEVSADEYKNSLKIVNHANEKM